MFLTFRVSSPRSRYAQPYVGYILLTKISFQHDVHTPSITGGIMVNRRVKCKYIVMRLGAIHK